MIHVRRHQREAAGSERLVRRGILRELVTHSERQRSGRDDHVLVGRMRVRRDGVVSRKLQADSVRNGLGWVAREHRDLRASWKHRRSGSPLRFLRRLNDVLGLSADDGERSATDDGGCRDGRCDRFHVRLLLRRYAGANAHNVADAAVSARPTSG